MCFFLHVSQVRTYDGRLCLPVKGCWRVWWCGVQLLVALILSPCLSHSRQFIQHFTTNKNVEHKVAIHGLKTLVQQFWEIRIKYEAASQRRFKKCKNDTIFVGLWTISCLTPRSVHWFLGEWWIYICWHHPLIYRQDIQISIFKKCQTVPLMFVETTDF